MGVQGCKGCRGERGVCRVVSGGVQECVCGDRGVHRDELQG